MSPTEFVRQLVAHEGETVEIKWRLHDGNLYYQRVTVPPKATRNAVDPEAKFMVPPDAAAVANVEVDRTIADRPSRCNDVMEGFRCILLVGHTGPHSRQLSSRKPPQP